MLCSTARKLSGRSRQPDFSLGPLVAVRVSCLFVSPLSQTTCSLPIRAFFLEENDNSLSELGWETGFELLVSVRCLGSLHHAHPSFQLEPSHSFGPGLLPLCSQGTPHKCLLEHFCGSLFLSGPLLSLPLVFPVPDTC